MLACFCFVFKAMAGVWKFSKHDFTLQQMMSTFSGTFQNVCDNNLCVFVEILKRFYLKCEIHHLNPPLRQEHNINLFWNRVQKYTGVRLIFSFSSINRESQECLFP